MSAILYYLSDNHATVVQTAETQQKLPKQHIIAQQKIILFYLQTGFVRSTPCVASSHCFFIANRSVWQFDGYLKTSITMVIYLPTLIQRSGNYLNPPYPIVKL